MVPDARLGPLESASNAQQDGTSMSQVSAELSLPNADNGLQMEIVIHATQVTLSPMDNVFKTPTHSSQPPTIFAPSGMKEPVLNVLTELSSIQTEFADKYQVNVQHGMLSMEFA